MKLPILLLTSLILSAGVYSFAQEAETRKEKRKNAYVIGFTPARKNNIYGLALGITGSEVMCGDSIPKKSHGIHIQLTGQGFFIPLNRKVFAFSKTLASDSSDLVLFSPEGSNRAFHNGILISAFGTWTYQTNGLALSALSSMGHKMNGVSVNLFSSRYGFINGVSVALNNQSHSVKGVQVGLFNRTVKLKGFQFGLWNVNEKRKLPLVNWSFKD